MWQNVYVKGKIKRIHNTPVYKGLGVVGIAFGENVKYLESGALENGLIIDVLGAQILEKMGVDVGLASVGATYNAEKEYFPKEKRYVAISNCPIAEITLKSGAQPQSFADKEHQKVASYTYENANEQKFLVLAFDGYLMNDHAIKQYARGRQIEEWIHKIGKKLPASMLGNPDCYMICKENDKERGVWIGNFFADECLNTTVVLSKEYTEIEFINCKGKLCGNIVELEYIAPYASVGFVVR